MTLPRALRNRLADVILESLHDAEARRALEAVAALSARAGTRGRVADLPDCALRDVFEERNGSLHLGNAWMAHAENLRERARRAWRAIDHRPLDPPDTPLRAALGVAALLFDAGLYYEVHEWLEPYWSSAVGGDREALKGLIQVSVGFEHLASGNARGACALLTAGCAKVRGRQLEELDLDPFARAGCACRDRIIARGEGSARDFDWAAVPCFPADVQQGAAPKGNGASLRGF